MTNCIFQFTKWRSLAKWLYRRCPLNYQNLSNQKHELKNTHFCTFLSFLQIPHTRRLHYFKCYYRKVSWVFMDIIFNERTYSTSINNKMSSFQTPPGHLKGNNAVLSQRSALYCSEEVTIVLLGDCSG